MPFAAAPRTGESLGAHARGPGRGCFHSRPRACGLGAWWGGCGRTEEPAGPAGARTGSGAGVQAGCASSWPWVLVTSGCARVRAGRVASVDEGFIQTRELGRTEKIVFANSAARCGAQTARVRPGAELRGTDWAPLATSTKSLTPCRVTEALVWACGHRS